MANLIIFSLVFANRLLRRREIFPKVKLYGRGYWRADCYGCRAWHILSMLNLTPPLHNFPFDEYA